MVLRNSYKCYLIENMSTSGITQENLQAIKNLNNLAEQFTSDGNSFNIPGNLTVEGDINMKRNKGIAWNTLGDYASIKYSGTENEINNLVFETTDDNQENFIFQHKPYTDGVKELLRIQPNGNTTVNGKLTTYLKIKKIVIKQTANDFMNIAILRGINMDYSYNNSGTYTSTGVYGDHVPGNASSNRNTMYHSPQGYHELRLTLTTSTNLIGVRIDNRSGGSQQRLNTCKLICYDDANNEVYSTMLNQNFTNYYFNDLITKS